MVKHIIMWQLKDEIQGEERETIKKEIKAGLEGLAGRIEGLQYITVQIDTLASSNADVLLDCALDDEDALKAYAVHPEHVAVAKGKIIPFVKTRICIDFEC